MPVLEPMLPVPVPEVTVHVTAVQGGVEEVPHVEVTAPMGTPVTVALKVKFSSVPTVAVEGVTLKRTPESTVTVVVPLTLPCVAVMVMVAPAGTMDGAV